MDEEKASAHLPETANAHPFVYLLECNQCQVLFGAFRSLVDKIHELVELRSDDDLRAAVALFAHFGVVRRYGIELAAASGCKALRVNAVLVDEGLHHA